jgi:hypothetical protein
MNKKYLMKANAYCTLVACITVPVGPRLRKAERAFLGEAYRPIRGHINSVLRAQKSTKSTRECFGSFLRIFIVSHYSLYQLFQVVSSCMRKRGAERKYFIKSKRKAKVNLHSVPQVKRRVKAR